MSTHIQYKTIKIDSLIKIITFSQKYSAFKEQNFNIYFS